MHVSDENLFDLIHFELGSHELMLSPFTCVNYPA